MAFGKQLGLLFRALETALLNTISLVCHLSSLIELSCLCNTCICMSRSLSKMWHNMRKNRYHVEIYQYNKNLSRRSLVWSMLGKRSLFLHCLKLVQTHIFVFMFKLFEFSTWSWNTVVRKMGTSGISFYILHFFKLPSPTFVHAIPSLKRTEQLMLYNIYLNPYTSISITSCFSIDV